MAGTDTTEGQALWQYGGAEEDSRLREGNRHLHLAYDDEEEEANNKKGRTNARCGCITLPFPTVEQASKRASQHTTFPEETEHGKRNGCS